MSTKYKQAQYYLKELNKRVLRNFTSNSYTINNERILALKATLFKHEFKQPNYFYK